MKLIGLFTLISIFRLALTANVIIATAGNFDDIVINSGKYSLVDFYASWCTHCKGLAPIYEELASHYAKASEKVQLVKIDADKHRRIGKRFKVNSYPTLMLFSPSDIDGPLEYNGRRDVDSLIEFITEQTDIAATPNKKTKNILYISNDKFENEIINNDKSALVAFTTNEEIYQSLIKEYEKVAEIYKNDNEIIIAQMDVSTKNGNDYEKLKSLYNIEKFPAILLFSTRNKQSPKFSEKWELPELITFINNNANLYRNIDGKLNTKAGLILTIKDDLVKLLKTQGDDKKIIATQILEELDVIDHKFKYYYKKIISKIIKGDKSNKYIKDEINRLTNLLKNPKLIRQKSDAIQQRLNILKLFKN